MKSLVVYSSKTGNTQRVAQAIYDVLPQPKTISRVEDAPPADGFDFIALGFWVDKGTADKKAQKYMSGMKKCKVGVFGTLGAYPDSDHAKQSMKKATSLLHGNEVIGTFLCQGKVDPVLVRMMAETMKDDPHHSMTPEREARLKEAAKHPDKTDLENAADIFGAMAVDLC